jgi:CO dehydrogenase maturation factor
MSRTLAAMKVAVSGKGGTGKTTIAATLARCFARRGFNVLAIDGDSNPNLGMSLGLDESAMAAMRPMPARALTGQRTAADLLEEYAISAPDGVRLVLAARIDQAGGG